jgi:AcrR family transcriptional regulator
VTSSASAPATRPRKRARRGSGEQLKADIVVAAKDLLAASADSSAVSIRAVADRVGVTPPSIYLHFADKDALIEAVVAGVFAELDAAMVAAGAHVDDPLQRLRAFGLAYVRFAVAHPEHYRVATMEQRRADAEGPGSHLDRTLRDSAFSHLRETVEACMAAEIFAAGDPLPVTLQMWAAAHGIAALLVAKPYLPWGDVEAMVDAVCCSAAAGRAVLDRLRAEPAQADLRSWLAAHPLPDPAGPDPAPSR